MSKLERKVALVTGASKGIGSGIANALASAGAAVVVNYASDRAGAEDVVNAITKAKGRAVAAQADVSKAADVARLLAEVDSALLPAGEAAIANLLSIFELEKGIYELQYELDNRPDWVAIPVAGIRRLLEDDQ